MPRRVSQHARRSARGVLAGVEANARLTSSVAVVIFVLLFLEGLTILRIQSLISPHVFIGMILVPVTLFKIASTTWRFAKYYRGDPEYRRKGPPAPLLRLLGPLLIVLTIAVLATGVGLVVGAPLGWHAQLLQLHQVSFLLWFMVMALHVVAHLVETVTLAPRDWLRRSRSEVRGASTRQWLLVSSLVAGLLIALWITPYAAQWTVGSK